ncbi:uncharacterized protein [Salminus brasiliensis]|uniref:uncharacterized protein isoform X2 n=1 Tax=Salminus brasiliensis TaxID=930266 RepID=UPI003B835409
MACIYQLSPNQSESAEEWEKRVRSFKVNLCLQAALGQRETIQTSMRLIISDDSDEKTEFLLDLYSHLKQYETKTGRSVLPALLPVYQSAPAEWIIDLSERKAFLLLEVLKLQTVKKAVKLRGWSNQDFEVWTVLQCLPYISQLSFTPLQNQRESAEEWEKRVRSFKVNLCLQAALYQRETIQTSMRLIISDDSDEKTQFLLDLYSHMKQDETETGRSVLPALLPVYQSAPAEWIIDLSERNSSLLLEVLKLQTVKKPVKLRGWSGGESAVRSFLQCLPYISRLRFSEGNINMCLGNLFYQAAERERETGEKTLKLLTSLCTYSSFSYGDTHIYRQCDFLLDLYSHLKQYETETGRSVLPALLAVYQSAPAEWCIDLSERKAFLLLEVLKLQTVKKAVKLRGWSDGESAVRSFLQCLPYISQLRIVHSAEGPKDVTFLINLFRQSVDKERQTGEKTVELLTSLCTYSSFPCGDTDNYRQCDFLLNLYSYMKQDETETGRSVLPALLPVYQSAPAEWIIDLSERNSSLLLEVLKLQTVKKPVKLRGWSDGESAVRSFLQCLPYISQLSWGKIYPDVEFVVNLFYQAAERERETGETTLELLTSLCTYSSFPYGDTDSDGDTLIYTQCQFLLDLYSYMKQDETETGRRVLPALLPVYQSAPAEWIIDLSERDPSLILEVLKLQTVKKPVKLRGWSDGESAVRSFLQCLPYISRLRIDPCWGKIYPDVEFVVNLFYQAAERERETGETTLELLTSLCTYSSFPYGDTDSDGDPLIYTQCQFLLDLYSYMKQDETETGRRVLPALLPVYQSAPAEWIIDLSERDPSLILEVLKLQTVKKPVKLRGWSDGESAVRSFLQCLPYISRLRIDPCWEEIYPDVEFVVNLFYQAAERERETGETTLELLTSLCTYSSFPYGDTDSDGDPLIYRQCQFLLDLYSYMKQDETETGRRVLPALLPVYQSAPAEWIIDLSERDPSLLLEVLKLQTVKKPVKLRGWSDGESAVRSFLQCLPYISRLRIDLRWGKIYPDVEFVVNLFYQAAERERETGETTLELLTSLCTYSSFPYGDTDSDGDTLIYTQCQFLLDLYSYMKQDETETGRRVLPALLPVYQSAPAEWIIDLSERNPSLLLEVLKLQTVKKPVKLRGWSGGESAVRSFLQCLPYISRLRYSENVAPFIRKLAVDYAEDAELVTALLTAMNSTFTISEVLPNSKCWAMGRVLGLLASPINLTLNPQAISLSGAALLFRCVTHLHKLCLGESVVEVMAQAFRAEKARAPLVIEELSVDLKTVCSAQRLSRVLGSLSSLLNLWNVQCLNLTGCEMEAHSLIDLVCHPRSLTIRVSKQTLQQLAVLVSEVKDRKLACFFLKKVGGDLSSCSLSWEELIYFLQQQVCGVTVNGKKSKITNEHVGQLLPLLDQVHWKRVSSSVVLSIIREIYETRSAHCVPSLLNSVKYCISLNGRELDPVHCAALRFTLQHCTPVSLSLLWTSIPEGELKSFLPLLSSISHLSVDRRLLLRLLHCCSLSKIQKGAEALVLCSLKNRLDFSCCIGLDLTTETQSSTLHLTPKDCSVITMAIQTAQKHTELILVDCEIEDAGVDMLFPVLHTVRLRCSKALLLQFLALVHVGTERESMVRAASLSHALGKELDLSETKLDKQTCRSLALVLEHTEGLSELDISHCQLTDHCLELLLPHLHKVDVLDLSHNDISDTLAGRIYSLVSASSNIETVRLFNNRITNQQPFLQDERFEIW